MACLPRSDWSFGPRISPECRTFDFTLRFEDIIFACVPAALFLVLTLPYMLVVFRGPAPVIRPYHRLFVAKLVALAGVFGLQLSFLILRTQSLNLQTDVSLAGDILSCLATVAALALSFASHQRLLRPSTLLSLYLAASAILSVPRVRTIWLLAADGPVAGVMTAASALTALTALLLEWIECQTPFDSDKGSRPAEACSGLWTRTTFAWLATTFRAGYARVISAADLPVLDPKLESRLLYSKLSSVWAKCDHKQQNSLLRSCFQSYLPSLLSALIPRLCVTAFTFSQPFLIKTTVEFIGQSDPSPDKSYGKGLIGAWALVYLGLAISNSIYQYQNLRFVVRLRGGLTALIYHQTLQTRAADIGDITAVSLMGTDVERIASGLRLFNETWGSLLDMTIACWLLEQQLSLACLAPVVLVIAFITATSKVAATAGSAQRGWIEKVQERLRVTSSALGDIKSIKMLGISHVMSDIIRRLRLDEVKTSRAFRKILVVTLLLSITPINLAPVITFAVYAIISTYWKNEVLLTAQAFTSIALISLLTTPVIIFIQALPMVIQCKGCFDRIQEYCNYSAGSTKENSNKSRDSCEGDVRMDLVHKQRDLAQPECAKSNVPGEACISLEAKTLAWDMTSQPVLKDIDVKIQRSAVTAFVGPVGSGKSALLTGLLREMVTPGTSTRAQQRREGMAYCAQQPWLENKTIRQNIIGAMPYDGSWYNMVKWACGLDIDISQLDRRDGTRIGSQGLSLSGGQKQRIALARAIYSKQAIVLLDDVFSGVDADTTSLVASRLLGQQGILRKQKTTVVLATHSETIIRLADNVIVLQDGKVVETGNLTSLLQSQGYVSKLGLSLAADEAIKDVECPEIIHQAPCNLDEAYDKTDSLSADVRRKNGGASVYMYYLASSGYLIVCLHLAFMVIWIVCGEFSTIWVKWWAESNYERPNKNLAIYLGIYAMLGAVATLGACLAAWTAIISIISSSAIQMHADLLQATIKAPFRFFANTDSGEMLNRFSQDMELIDMELPTTLVNYSSSALSCLTKVIIIAVFSKYLGIAIPFIGMLLFLLQSFYLQTSRQIRLLGIEAKAPLYASFTETAAGAATIRAFGWQPQYQERNFRGIDASQQPEYLLSCCQYCLGFVLGLVTAIVVVTLVSITISLRSWFSPGSVGVSLVMVVGLSDTFVQLIQTWTKLESSIGAVARVKGFIEDTESEEKGSTETPTTWPQTGALEMTDLTVSYGPTTDPVLRNVSMSIEPGQHVAICGRSGGGKSSLILSLMQMMDVRAGRITVDEVDLSRLARDDTRARINVVAQDPFLLPGSVRLNIDPFATAPDDRIIKSLERVGLWSIIEEHGGLDEEMNPTVWSAGQKQLLCFARALTRNCKILVLDEAMSSVDAATEALIQAIIDSELKNCTVLSVMHRLKHVASYDRVAVIENGSLLLYDEPSKLLMGATRLAELYRLSEHC